MSTSEPTGKLCLRPYQQDALAAAFDAITSRPGDKLIVLPTGTGKALCIADFIDGMLEAFPEYRIINLVHSRELVEQNFEETMRHMPSCPAGIYCAGLNRRDADAQVLFASIQSVQSKAAIIAWADLIIVDEAHAIPHNEDTGYRSFISALRANNPAMRVVGFTATPYRLDRGMLHEGDGALFDEIVYEYDLVSAIGDGYLAEPVAVSGDRQIDTSGIKTRNGEFVPGQLEAAAMDGDNTTAIVDEIMSHGATRRGWIVFGTGVKHCKALRDELRHRGVSCDGVFAKTPSAERREIIAAFKRQEIRCLVSVVALTTGFNAPHVDLVALARPTKSAGLYVQAVGRGTRLSGGKSNCLVLDFGGNIERFGPIDKIRVRKKATPDDEHVAPLKTCPACEERVPISVSTCPNCGHEFSGPAIEINSKAASGALISTQAKAMRPRKTVPVNNVTYHRHVGPSGVPCVRVDYLAGLTTISEWICPEHSGIAGRKAREFWDGASVRAGLAMPVMADRFATAAKTHLLAPVEIDVVKEGKRWQVCGRRYEASA